LGTGKRYHVKSFANRKENYMTTELELDHFFWKAISTNVAFQAWFLDRTKFANHALELVGNEKSHQRWYRDPVTGKDSETESAGINRHIVGDERALRKRRSESIPASSLACDLARDHSEA
jgi:hypothetical protein